jgi:ArsR family transcriptional regulator
VIADLGCGHRTRGGGAVAVRGQVIGVDQSAAMLKAAQRRTAGLANVELRKGALEALPIDDASVDGALLVLALSYVEHAAPVLRELARILRPGGRAVVVDLLRHDRDDFRRQMGQTTLGLEPGELEEMMEGPASRESACGRCLRKKVPRDRRWCWPREDARRTT